MCLAVPGRVAAVERREGTLMAEVDFGGLTKQVCLEYLPDVTTGDYVIVHVGFAIQRLDEASAKATLASFAGLGLLTEEFGPDGGGPDGVGADGVGADGVGPDGVGAGGEGKRVVS